jgi:hypothetical protein
MLEIPNAISSEDTQAWTPRTDHLHRSLTERTRCSWRCARRVMSGRRWRQEIKMVQEDSVNTSRPCASLTTMQSSGLSCSPACFNSLITRAANLRASSSSCRIVPSVLPYSLTLSRHVTTKWYRGKCAPLSASRPVRKVTIGSRESPPITFPLSRAEFNHSSNPVANVLSLSRLGVLPSGIRKSGGTMVAI